MTKFFTPARRKWLYGIVTAAAPLAVLYGVVSAEAAPLWVGAAASVLATTTAVANTPKSDGKHAAAEGEDVDEDGAALPT